MIPVVTPAEMAEVDARAPEPVDVLIDRAGAAVAWAARRRMGGVYGRRVGVLAGSGNNGADGRVAARRLRSWGARVVELAPSGDPIPSGLDLVIDAAYGMGLSRPYTPPQVHVPVLAVDIPSGVDGLTGAIAGDALRAVETVTFQALKPGLLLHPGAERTGTISVVDLGLEIGECHTHLVESSDVAAWIPARAADAHKWRAACWVIGGSPGMTGAPHLAAAAAARAGAGYVRLSVPGAETVDGPIEAVGHALVAEGWADTMDDLGRFGAVVVGPGLGRSPAALADVRTLLGGDAAVVLDGDGLHALAGHLQMIAGRRSATVLTPHDGEFEAVTGARPGPDRIGAARELAAASGAVVLLKGPATVVAGPDGEVLLVTAGDQRLATAGTGDVLAGIIGALVAQGLSPLRAAAAGAWIHGRSAIVGPARGMVASDLLVALPEVLHAADLG